MSEITVGIVALIFLLGFFLTGIELAFAMALVGVAGFSIVVSPSAAMHLLANDFFDSLSSYGFTVVPLFILMGQVAFNAGVARRLYDAGYRFVGHIPGGLAIATVVGTTVFKAICGSVVATVATFASVAIPEMDRYKYSRKLSTGIVATVGTLGVLLPPSVTLIVVGIITQLSIGKLFMAGIVPGLIIAFFFAVVIVGWCKINPEIGPRGDRFTWKERMSAGSEVVWPVVIFMVIIGGFVYGFFSPTEAGEHRRLCRDSALYSQEGHRVQGGRQIPGRSPAQCLHGPLAHCRFHGPRPFHCRHEHPPGCSRLDRQASHAAISHHDFRSARLPDRRLLHR